MAERKLFKVKVDQTNGDKSGIFYTLALDIEMAMNKALGAAADSFETGTPLPGMGEVNPLEVVSAAEINGEWVP